MRLIQTEDFDTAIRTVDQDVLLVRPGVTLPLLAAERLAWSADRTPGAATISPIVDSAAEQANFAPIVDHAAKDWTALVRRVDECCAEVGGSAGTDADPSRACVFVRHRAIGDVLAENPEAGWTEFVALTRALKYGHRIAGHVYAITNSGPSNFAALPTAHGENVRKLLLDGTPARAIDIRAKPRQLHILHGWGGGAEQWVRDYCAHDTHSINFVLTTECRSDGTAIRLCLYARLGDPAAMHSWPLTPEIEGTLVSHDGYRAALIEIVTRLGIDRVIISSLVGHSLDALRTGLPTLLTAHDYYPFCPVFSITLHGKTCLSCDVSRLAHCRRENRLYNVFPGVPATEWERVRARFLADVATFPITIAGPSESVRRNYAALAPELAARVHVIPHGTPPLEFPLVAPLGQTGARLRILVPGRLSESKGVALLEQALPGLLEFADVTLAGCGERGQQWRGTPGVTVIENYRKEELADVLRKSKPDLALLLSIVPETFSYTLQEIFAAGIAPLAVRVGAFEDRIQDGVNGFLCEPDPSAILSSAHGLDQARDSILRVHERLRLTPVRSVQEMIRDYEALRGERWSAAAYFASGPPAHWNPATANRLQLFWRAPGQPFDESSSVNATISEDESSLTVTLAIPPVFPRLSGLRLDPGVRRGFALLSRMTLRDSAGAEVWSWNGGKAFFDPAMCHEVDDLGDTEDGKRLLYLVGIDPHLGLPCADETLAKLSAGGSFEIDLAYPDPNRFIDELMRRVDEEKRAAMAAVEARVQRQEQIHHEALDQERNRLFYVLEAREALLKQLMGLYEYERHHGRTAMQELEAMRGSLSWRITAPLRGAMKPFTGK